jgi:glycosyltransferase involved in cell wall biosynthesis
VHNGAGPGLTVTPVKATLIIPALNEADAIGSLLRRVPREVVDEVIVVDNGSTDATGSISASAGARVISEPRRGYGAACWAGVSALRPDVDVAVFLDGDGSQHPEELAQVLAPVVADQADLVLGARQFGCDHPLHATLGTRLVAAFVAWRYRVTLSDIGPYRAIRVPLLKRLGCATAPLVGR